MISNRIYNTFAQWFEKSQCNTTVKELVMLEKGLKFCDQYASEAVHH